MENKPVLIWWGREWLDSRINLIEPAPSQEIMLAQLDASKPDLFTEAFEAKDNAEADIIGTQKLKEEYDKKWQNKKTPITPSA